MKSSSPLLLTGRMAVIDVVRGGALALMIAYHFCFDLNYFGVLSLDMNRAPLWLGLRGFIVTLFLATMGVSLHLATAHGLNLPRYLRRLGMLLLAASLVSVGSWLMFPSSWIFFGVLHFIALASVLGLAFVRLYRLNLILGIGLILLGASFAHPWFDQPAWQWLGLMTHKPVTEDYVPLLPWFGVVLLGLFVGKGIFGRTPLSPLAAWQGAGRLPRLMARGGRHSLLIYLVHQPLLLGILYLVLEH